MDNLRAHRPKRFRQRMEARGCELLYLPSYSHSSAVDLFALEQ